jgi:lipopolysaccharide transport system permease protein
MGSTARAAQEGLAAGDRGGMGYCEERQEQVGPALRAVGSREPIARLLSPLHAAANLWKHRGILGAFTARGVRERHRGSALGLVWAVVQPLVMLAVYTFVFAMVWRTRWGVEAGESTGRFALTVFAGLVVWEVFAGSVGAAAGLIVGNPNFVKKVVFPLEVLPLAHLGATVVFALISVVVLVIGTAVVGDGVSRTLWAFPAVLLTAVVLSAGVTLLVAALGVFLRDIRVIVQGLLLQVLFFMTPIFYPVDRVPDGFRAVIEASPMATIVESARRTLVFGTAPDWAELGAAGLIALVVFQCGWAFFHKAKRGFADVL